MSQDRHLLFTGPDFDIHLKITEAERHNEIYGQLISHTSTEESAIVALARHKEREETKPGPFGEFSFDQVPAGNVTMEIMLPGRVVLARFDV